MRMHENTLRPPARDERMERDSNFQFRGGSLHGISSVHTGCFNDVCLEALLSRGPYSANRFIDFLEPRKPPKKVSGREIPSQRNRRARMVVKGTAALEPAPHMKRFSIKKTEKVNLRDSGRRDGRREGENERHKEGGKARERQTDRKQDRPCNNTYIESGIE